MDGSRIKLQEIYEIAGQSTQIIKSYSEAEERTEPGGRRQTIVGWARDDTH